MAPLHIMGFCQNLLIPVALNSTSVMLTSQRFVSKSVIRKLKLPEPPKRAASAYNKFVALQSPLLRKKYPDSKQSEILKFAALLWKSADESTKKKLKDESLSESKEYKKQKEEYNTLVLKPNEEDIKKQEKLKERRVKAKELKELGKPVRPCSPYNRFTKAHMESRGNLSVSEFMKVLGSKWKSLPEEEKLKYRLEYENEKKVYEKELENWNNKLNDLLISKAALKVPKKPAGNKKEKNADKKDPEKKTEKSG